MKFKFRLEKVLSFLKLQETMLKMEVATLARRATELRARMVTLEEDTRRILEETPLRLAENPAWAPYQTSQVALNTKRVRELQVKYDQVRNDWEIKKLELGRHAMRRKALENLRANKLSEFKIEETRKDQKKMDELFQLSSPKGHR